MKRKIINIAIAIVFSAVLVLFWERVIGILLAIAIPEHYVKNEDGSYTGNIYVILLWDFFVVHVPALLMPCLTFSLVLRLWVVRNSTLIFWSFLAVYLLRYLQGIFFTLPVLLAPSLLQSIYIMLPTPYPALGVLLGVWLGHKLDRRPKIQNLTANRP